MRDKKKMIFDVKRRKGNREDRRVQSLSHQFKRRNGGRVELHSSYRKIFCACLHYKKTKIFENVKKRNKN